MQNAPGVSTFDPSDVGPIALLKLVRMCLAVPDSSAGARRTVLARDVADGRPSRILYGKRNKDYSKPA